MVVLTKEERARFASWLKQEAATEEGLAAQMDSLGSAVAAGAKLYRTRAAAKLIVAKDLENVEEQSL